MSWLPVLVIRHKHLTHYYSSCYRSSVQLNTRIYIFASITVLLYWLVSLFILTANVRLQVRHDMTAPMSHYYIYTGHNSYLTGNQLSSDCSDVPIIKALQRGVRVIELDIWPNSARDNIDVLHGRYLPSAELL